MPGERTFEVRVFGTDAMLFLELWRGTMRLHRACGAPHDYPPLAEDEIYPLHAPAENLVDAAADAAPNRSPAALGWSAMKLIEAACESCAHRRRREGRVTAPAPPAPPPPPLELALHLPPAAARPGAGADRRAGDSGGRHRPVRGPLPPAARHRVPGHRARGSGIAHAPRRPRSARGRRVPAGGQRRPFLRRQPPAGGAPAPRPRLVRARAGVRRSLRRGSRFHRSGGAVRRRRAAGRFAGPLPRRAGVAGGTRPRGRDRDGRRAAPRFGGGQPGGGPAPGRGGARPHLHPGLRPLRPRRHPRPGGRAAAGPCQPLPRARRPAAAPCRHRCATTPSTSRASCR